MWPGGFETIVATKSGQRYEILYLPDLHNDELQSEGKSPVYYWLPNGVRIARAGDVGDFKFHLIHFEGVMSPDTTTGVTAPSEVAGGVLGLTVTCAPPLDVLDASHQQIKDRLRGDGRKYWGWRTPADPQFAPVPISDSRTHMSNLSPRLDGTVPSSQPPGGGVAGPTPTSTGAAAGGAAGAAGGGGAAGGAAGAPKSTVATRSLSPRLVRNNVPVRANRDVTPTGLDAWYMRIEGEGPGSLNPAGENAYVALCGSLPTAILWAGFHGTYSPIVVSQTLNLKVWSETLRIHIHGDWDRVFSHFSAAAQGRGWWWSADIKAEFNNLRINGGITVEVEIDGTNPGADKMKEEVDKRIDLIVNKFTEQAKARIFDPAPPDVKPAEASGGGGGLLSSIFGGFGGGFALKYRRDETKLTLDYDETRQERFNLSTTISSSLEGFYNEIKADPDAEKKYFTTLFLEDWDRKITHNIKPVVNWPDPGRKWVGEPVAFLACQIGYPAATGDIQWTPHVFQSTDTNAMTTWQPAFAKKGASDVSNAPGGWTPDISYIKRSIHFTEPPSETDNPLVRCFVEKNVVELDPGPNGTATNDQNIEVRADSAGKLDVGPIGLGALLDGPAQTVEVEFQAHGKTDEGRDRPVTRFMFSAKDQDLERYWTIFTGQPAFVPSYQYRVHVVIKGSLFTHGLEWWGDWVQTSGNGPVMLTVPTSDEAAQVRKLAPASKPGAATPVSATSGATSAGQPAGHPVAAGKPQGSKSTTAGKPGSTRSAPVEVQGYTVGGSHAPEPATKDAPAEAPAGTHPAERGAAEREPEPLALSEGWSAMPPSKA
jgi:hypothetical protein